jgi:hypothetical protein
MQPYWQQPLRDSTLNWAEWKVLDLLLQRYFPAAEQLGQAAPATADGFEARLRELLDGVDPAALGAACRELSDTESPVMRALIAVWAQRGADDAGAHHIRLAGTAAPPTGTGTAGTEALHAQLGRLSAEQALVVLAVVAQACLGT